MEPVHYSLSRIKNRGCSTETEGAASKTTIKLTPNTDVGTLLPQFPI